MKWGGSEITTCLLDLPHLPRGLLGVSSDLALCEEFGDSVIDANPRITKLKGTEGPFLRPCGKPSLLSSLLA